MSTIISALDFVDDTVVPAAAPFIVSSAGEVRVLDGRGPADAVAVDLVTATPSADEAARPSLCLKSDRAYDLHVWDPAAGAWTRGGSVDGPRTVLDEGRLYWLVQTDGRRLERPLTVEPVSGAVADPTRRRIVHW